jgi:hypothetical protein
MPSQDINIKVNARNAASPTLKRVQQDIAGLDKVAGTAAGGLGAMGKALGVAGLVAFGAQVAGATVELAKMGAQSLALKSSFEQVQGGAANATAILESLRSASRGMISDYDLMLAANKAALLGVADTAEEMSGLLQIAATRGRAMGISSTQAFNDIVTGLGRMSPLILDNLGITVNLEQVTADYAATLGKSAAALTDAERKQALVNSVIASSASLMGDANSEAQNLAGQGFAQLDAAWANFQKSLGESLAPFLDARAAEIAAFLQSVSSGLNQSADYRKSSEPFAQSIVAPELERVRGELARLQAERANIANESFVDVPAGVDVSGIISANTAAIDKQIADTERYIAQLEERLAQAISVTGGAMQVFLPIIAETTGAIEEAVTPVDNLSSAFQRAAEMVSKSGADGLFAKMLGETGDIDASLEGMKRVEAGLAKIIVDLEASGVAGDDLAAILDVLIGEIGNVISAGPEMGDSVSGGLLAGIPAGQALIAMLRDVLGWTNAVSGSIRAMQAESGWRPNTRGFREGFRGLDFDPTSGLPSMGRGAGAGGLAGGKFSSISGKLAQRQAGIGGRGIAADLISQMTGGGGGGGSGVDSELNDLANRVKSVLSGALKSGINLGDILGREDAVEEPARRLADIAVRGFESPWTSYIRDTFPEIWEQISTAGDPKQAAAQILKDFEAGLRPELLDKSRAKELVKRALLGESNMASLATEIATELAGELGISLEQAQSAASSVLGGGSSTEGIGAVFGDGAVSAVTAGDVGARMVAALATQLGAEDNLQAIYVAGQSYGAQWGSGFLAAVSGNVPGGLIAVLIAAVTPGVQAAIAMQGGRTGATGGAV